MDIQGASAIILNGCNIGLTPTVRICVINDAFLTALHVMTMVYSRYGVPVVITSGCDYDPHRVHEYHAAGYAWDFRSRDFSDPVGLFSVLEANFSALDKRWRVLYHDQGSGFHYHVEYRYDKPRGGTRV